MARSGLRFLSRVFANLPDEIKKRPASNGFHKPAVVEPTVTVSPPSIGDLLSRLDRMEVILSKILTQKRVKVVERDSDDLIIRVTDIPMEENNAL